MLNTTKTVAGYLFSLLDRVLPFNLGANSSQKIYNYLECPDLGIVTSGQPSERQLALIADEGYRVILNLAPHQTENALSDEASTVESLGMQYCHLPVDFKNPSENDFSQFIDILKQYENGKLWVHCAANMRVSAFVYRYRCEILGHDSEHAEFELHKIWKPAGVWKRFVKKPWPVSSKS